MLTSVHETFGQRLRALRQSRELTQAKLAERIDISVDYLSKIERGLASPSFAIIENLSRFFKTEPATFFAAERTNATPRMRDAADREAHAQIFADCVDPILLVSLEGLLLDMNPQAERELGYAREDLVGRPASAVIPTELRDIADEHLRRCKAGQEIKDYEAYLLHKSGNWIPALMSLSLIRDPAGAPLCAAFITKNTLALKHHQAELQETLDERECLLRELHHRVLNNLQIIISMLELSFRREQTPSCQAKIRDMISKLQAIGGVHAQVYNKGRLSRVNLAQFASDHVAKLMAIFKTSRITPTYNLERVLLPVTQAIPFALVFNEVMTNVLKHAYPGGGKGTVGVDLEEVGERIIRLAITDHGRGIPPGVDPQTADTLGFTLIRTIVANQLGGNVQFSNKIGATVRIEFARNLHPAPCPAP